MTIEQSSALHFVPVVPDDRQRLIDWLTSDEWPYHSPTPPEKREQAIVDRFFNEANVESFWGIAPDGEAVALIRLFDLADPTPLFDLRIRSAHRGKGLGRASLRWLTSYVFENKPEIGRLAGYTRADNLPMRGTFAACGYVKEAHYRGTWRMPEGGMQDTIGYGIMRDDWSRGASTSVSLLDGAALPLLDRAWQTERLDIRTATLDEVSQLHAVFTACAYASPWDSTFTPGTSDEHAELVQKSSATDATSSEFFTLQSIRLKGTEEIIGYFHIYHGLPLSSIVFLSLLVVHPDHQKSGVASELVTGLTARLKELGYGAVWLEVYLKNWPALRFWSRAGFTTIREWRGDNVFSENGHARVILERKL